MNKNKAILLCAALFESYPKVDNFHVTSDGQAFAEKQNAEAHADFLDKKQPVVISVSRDDKAEKEVKPGKPADPSSKGDAPEESEAVKKLRNKLKFTKKEDKPAVQAELDALIASEAAAAATQEGDKA